MPRPEPNDLVIQSAGAIEHILKYRPDRIQRLFLSKHSIRLNHIESLARENDVQIEAFTGPKGESDIKAELLPFEYTPWEKLLEVCESSSHCTVVVLDHLQDPQNLGAIVRSADALGVAGVILPKDRSVAVSAGTYHASVGAVETLPICRVVNIGTAMRELKQMGFWIVGASLSEKATPPWEMPDFEKVILVMGAEYEGLAEHTEKNCDWHVQIPLSGKMPSLNVSASAAILMYELARRKCSTKA